MSIDEDEDAPAPVPLRKITHIAYLTDECGGQWGLAVWWVQDTNLTDGGAIFGDAVQADTDPRPIATERLRRAGFHLVGPWQRPPDDGSRFAAWAIRTDAKPYIPGPGPRHR